MRVTFNFQTRIVLLFTLLFVSVQTFTLVTIYQVYQKNVIEQVSQNLTYSGRIFDRLLRGRGERMAAEVAILSADYAFRSTISSGDAVTLRSALENLQLRIHAQRAFYIELNGQVTADTQLNFEKSAFPFQNALDKAENDGRSVTFALINGQPHVLVTVPVLAPIPIGWIAVATSVNNRFVEQFKRLSPSALEITIAERLPQELRLLATTLAQQEHAYLLRPNEFENPDAPREPILRTFPESRWLGLSYALPSAQQAQTIVVQLNIPLDLVLKPYSKIQYSAIALFGLGLLGVLLGGIAVARQVSQPVRQLAKAAQRVKEGDFSQAIVLRRQDELGRLAQSFNLMMQGIADREERIIHQLRHDTLTGLPNRLYLEEYMQTTQHQEGYALILVGLERFAEINSTLGHEFGDQLMQSVGEILQLSMPENAALAHFSGDEFALIIPTAYESTQLQQFASLIISAFDAPLNFGPATVDMSIHIGIVHSPHDGEDPKTLLRKADAALFVARRDGLHYHIYSDASNPCQPEALSLMGELRTGLETGQFTLYVQPQLDIKLNQVTHVECLIRWCHPERGLMPPDTFIPLAEQTGNIWKITAWVLQEAFRIRALWQQAGLEIKLALNLSAHDLQHEQLPKLLAELLKRYPVSSEDFILEITESAIMLDAEHALKVLSALKAQGFKLSVDDFGTGYSSMAYLKKLPLSELKIDKTFVLNLADNLEDEVIVRSIIELGHNLGFNVVAEGLENALSFDKLAALRCDLVQGYWLSKPMPAEHFQQWMQRFIAKPPFS